MNSPQAYRWISALVILVLLIGCSTTVLSGEVPDAASEDEFWRTTYCVAGGLPMEVRFSLVDNPVRLEGDAFDSSEIDRISGQVDIKVAALLKDSIAAAWRQTYGNKVSEWSSERTRELAELLVVEIVARAPDSLGISFCGSSDQVGDAAFAAISGYFSRAVQLDGGRDPSWLAHTRERSNGGIIVMLAVALRLARIEFDTKELVRTLTQ